jgi:hypothetical protein
VERGEPNGPLTGAWEAVRRPGNGGEGGGGRTPVQSALGFGEWEMGGGDPHPFIGSEGERGVRTGKGIGRPVVVASMTAVRFGGEGKGRVSGE